MMQKVAILAVAVFCLMAPTTAKVSFDETDVDKGQQILFNLLLNNFDLGKVDKDFYEIGRDFDIEKRMEKFDDDYKKIVRPFFDRYKLGMLPRDRLFSPFNSYLMNETELLFKVFYFAPDVWTLIYFAVWSSFHVNKYQFIYAFHTALFHREDTQTMPILPMYQVIPEFYFNTDVMREIYEYKMSLAAKEHVEPLTHTVIANYTGWYAKYSQDPESELSYFREDIGLNTWYYNWNQRYAYFMSRGEYPKSNIHNSGAMYANVLKFIGTRYDMERMSWGLDFVEPLDLDKPIVTGYTPYMTYPNGMHFPQRKEWSPIPSWNNEFLEINKQYTSRIHSVIDSRFYFDKDGKFSPVNETNDMDVIGSLIQGNYESVNKDFYGSIEFYIRRLLGFSPLPHNDYHVLPSALEQYSTSMRDPAFFRICKKINSLVFRYQENLGPRGSNELAFDGVTLEAVDLVEKRLNTYFEKVVTPVQRFWLRDYQHLAEVKASQYRLNHKPFTFKISINSEKETRASIRIFLGPVKNIHGKEISDNWRNLYQFDFFIKDLHKGKNIIERKSIDAPWFAPDYEIITSYKGHLKREERIAFDRNRYGFPARLALPKGTPEGMPLQFFIVVTKFAESVSENTDPILQGLDNQPFGFPLDRPLYNFEMPNMKLLRTEVVHKDDDTTNLTTV